MLLREKEINTRNTIKLNTSKGEFKQTLLGDNPDLEEFCKHFIFFMHHKEKTGVKEKLEKRNMGGAEADWGG